MTSRSREEGVLARIISTVGSSLELDEVLASVVELLSDASAVRACFVYLVDDSGDRLVLRAAGEPYAHLVGEIAFSRGESLAWWCARHREAAFIRERALDDPRTKEVPEFEEDRFQSLVAVPVLSRAGEEIGGDQAHTEAPREFTDDEVSFLVTVARLVAGAIENASLYEEARRRVEELEQLTALAESIAQATTLDALLPLVARAARSLLHASACHLYLLEGGTEELEWRASDPPDDDARRTLGLAELGPELARGGRAARVSVPLVAGDELVGLLVARDTASIELARAVASQTAVGVRKLQLIERLTERNLIKEFFEELAGGRERGDLVGRATRLGCDLDATHVVLAAAPADDALALALASAFPGSLFDLREESLRGCCAPRPAASSGSSRAFAACTPSSPHPSPSASRRPVVGSPAIPTRSSRRARPSSAQPSCTASRRSSPSRSSVPTSTCSGSPSTARRATPRWLRSSCSPGTTRRAGRRWWRRSRSSCAATGRSARPPTPSTSTRTRCVSASGASRRSRGSTSGETTG